MTQYLEPLVQKIETVCDLAGLDQLSTVHKKLISEAQKLSRAYAKMMTPKERLQLENMSLSKRKYALLLERERNNISENRLALQRLINTQKIHNNETRIATQNTTRQLSADRVRMAELRRLTQAERTQTEALRLKNRELQKSQSAFSNLKGIIGSFVGFIGIQSIGGLVRTAAELDLVQRSIESLTKSTQDWEYIQNEAFRTGTGIEDVAKGYRNFFSSTKMAGFDKSSIQGMYSDILTVTRATGASPIQTQGALLALEQMVSKGVVSMEELRRQLGNAVPGAFEIAAKAIGMTTQELNEMVKSGKLASVEFVPAFIKALYNIYSGGFKKAMGGLQPALENLGTAWKLFAKYLLTGEVGKQLTDIVNTLSAFLRSDTLKVIMQLTSDILSIVLWLFKHINIWLPLVIGYLGWKGLAGVLKKNFFLSTRLLRIFTLLFGGRIVTAIHYITKGLWKMSLPLLKFYGIALAVIAVLVLLQDILYSLPFMAKKGYRGTMTDVFADIDKKNNAQFGSSEPFSRAKSIGEKQKEIDKLKTMPMKIYSAPSSIIPTGNAQLSKTNNVNVNAPITIVDSNNPQVTGETVNEYLVGIAKSLMGE